MTDEKFIKEVFEIAFGVDCMEYKQMKKDIDYYYYKQEALAKLMEFSDNALKWEEGK